MTSARAGSSALLMYGVTRRRRHRRTVAAVVLLVAAVAVAAIAPAAAAITVAGHRLPAALPIALSLTMAAAALLCAASTRVGPLRDADRWRRGAEGERRTADLLDTLPSRGWAVWHDLRVPGSRANIDHLVVGRTGVWVVDTKAPRGVVRAGWRSVRFGAQGRKLDTGPVRWEAEVVGRHLEEAVGRRLSVRPIVAVHPARPQPGDPQSGGPQSGRSGLTGGLPPRGVRVGGVRVVTADRLSRRIRRGRRRLSRADRRLVCRAVEETWG